ncbi:MAG TPA: ADP-ribosylglycohydrolase family protein [Rectinema sp.]|nr:ADP-ribosylglycohydrolase family protein [Rectinema sp.]
MTQQEHLPHHSSERQQEHLPHHSSERQLEHSTESSTGHKSQPELESIPSKPPLNLIRGILTAYAVGDAMGMPTEFMTRAEISSRFGLVDRLLEPSQSKNHPNLPKASITDDTEQVCTLLEEYSEKDSIDPYITAKRLLRWMRDSNAIEKGYIGPSSRLALEAIERGESPEEAGKKGTTCGGVMRSPAAVLFATARQRPLANCVRACLIPTHNTQLAMEPAMAYGYALHAAICGKDIEGILSEAKKGAEAAQAAPDSQVYPQCGASVVARLLHFKELASSFSSPDEVLDFIYYVYGTTLASVDVATAAMCIFLSAKDDVWLSIRMGTSVGGDTDTIAALAGALSAAYALSHGQSLNIPKAIVSEVLENNKLDFDRLAERLYL